MNKKLLFSFRIAIITSIAAAAVIALIRTLFLFTAFDGEAPSYTSSSAALSSVLICFFSFLALCYCVFIGNRIEGSRNITFEPIFFARAFCALLCLAFFAVSLLDFGNIEKGRFAVLWSIILAPGAILGFSSELIFKKASVRYKYVSKLFIILFFAAFLVSSLVSEGLPSDGSLKAGEAWALLSSVFFIIIEFLPKATDRFPAFHVFASFLSLIVGGSISLSSLIYLIGGFETSNRFVISAFFSFAFALYAVLRLLYFRKCLIAASTEKTEEEENVLFEASLHTEQDFFNISPEKLDEQMPKITETGCQSEPTSAKLDDGTIATMIPPPDLFGE